MAVYNLEEQEQIDALKAWWKQYGNLLLLALVLILTAAAAVVGWRAYQQRQAEQAAELYAGLQKAAQSGDLSKVRQLSGGIIDKFGGTAYAPMAALISAKANYQAGDAKSAKAQLQLAAERGDDETRDIARLRLIGVVLDEKNYAEALSLVESKRREAFDPRYLELKGDILVAQGKTQEARTAYQTALAKIDSKSAYRSLLQVKLDALGGAQ